ncbi:replication protein A 70 kDa DNA-binding subunit B-like [Oryza glaberrima]|uniref:replication protein A 70 kDa DNA-binding subunit B-like n=1 Tax=Oryza glaberrima TaxID=4538 RepID=UPI00224C0F56|nr:replication protein A 70 kDa DNA-binding subunit B-like [Oryza glaberrima]
MILFTTWTEIEECIGGPADFPTIVYSLTSYNDVPNLVGNADRFVDVVGVITEITTPTMLRPKSREADSLKRTVQICDANNSILNVALWGERALAFQAEDIYNAGKKEPQIVLFVGTLVKDYTKSGIGLALSGCSACKWYINIDIPEIAELKKKLGEKLQPIKWVETAATVYEDDTVERKTVAELKKLNPHKCRRLRFITSVTIRKICNENSWWYRSCQKCFKGAKPYGYTYKCGSCSWIGMATPRYKLALTAGDDSDNTEFILFGKTAQRLVRKPIEALIDKIPEASQRTQKLRGFIPSEQHNLRGYFWTASSTYVPNIFSDFISYDVTWIKQCSVVTNKKRTLLRQHHQLRNCSLKITTKRRMTLIVHQLMLNASFMYPQSSILVIIQVVASPSTLFEVQETMVPLRLLSPK